MDLNDYGATVIAAIISACISLLCLIINTVLAIKGYREEIRRMKVDISLNRVTSCINDIQRFLDDLLHDEKKDMELLQKLYDTTLTSILSFGSQNAVKIIAGMQMFRTERRTDNRPHTESTKLFAYLALLVCQLKHDVCNERVSPLYFYQIRLKSYNTMIDKLISYNNMVVKELRLKRFMRIKKSIMKSTHKAETR